MAVEKGLVLAAIEAKLKGKSLSKNFKENLAAKWAERIETDEDVDSFIDDREDVLLEASSEADRRAQEAVKKVKVEKVEEVKVDDNNPNKELLSAIQALTAKVDGFENAQKTKSLEERFRADERLKGVPEFLIKRSIPKSDEEFDSVAEELAQEYKSFAEKNKLSSYGNDTPASGEGKGGKTKQISLDDAKKMV